jgi:DNA repair exonuclease SbcCD ATPase subunit
MSGTLRVSFHHLRHPSHDLSADRVTANQAASDLDKRLKKMKTKSTTKKYTGVELALIGKQCSTKLPPASAVQAMFLYEYERKAEDEKFFHSRMFQLRREEEAATLERAKAAETIQALEARVKQLEKTTASRDREASDRLTKSSTRIKATQETLDQHMTNINDLSTKLADVTTDMQALQTAVTSNTTEAISPTTIADHANALAALQTDVLNLFEDRDGMITLVTDTRARVTKLEDNVRALTLQNAAIKPPSSVQPHRLPMATSYGEKFDLAVPKGMAHVSLKAETNGRKANSVI